MEMYIDGAEYYNFMHFKSTPVTMPYPLYEGKLLYDGWNKQLIGGLIVLTCVTWATKDIHQFVLGERFVKAHSGLTDQQGSSTLGRTSLNPSTVW